MTADLSTISAVALAAALSTAVFAKVLNWELSTEFALQLVRIPSVVAIGATVAIELVVILATVPTMLFESLTVRCAMMIGGVHDTLTDVDRQALLSEVTGRHRWGIPEARAEQLIDGWVERIVEATVDDRLGEHVRTSAGRLAAGRPGR